MARQSGTGHSVVDLYDEASLLPSTQPPFNGIRLPDGRALAWAEYGSPRSVPCILLPDTGSSRLAPRWLLHDTALPAPVRLLAVDRPGVGASDPVGFGGQEDPAEDLRHLVETLAVGRIAVLGIGQGAADALAFASRYPSMVTAVLAVSARMRAERPNRHHPLRPSTWSTGTVPAGPVAAWLRAAGHDADLTAERTWQRAIRRMDDRAARVLGDRWRDADFREALAADLSQSVGSWTSPAVAPPQPDWERVNCVAPVQIWHGRDETGTTLGHVRAVAERHFGWQVTPVDGCSAVFGAWSEILASAADSFRPIAA
ncbi:MAG TPA: alpha/beta hydrolase [Nakamurella sp.]|jgi:pimeloyl-ACP methyl ester carboxylesterase|nr:alpha/beta hydrolase [Nakamurella sp.]